MNTEMIVKQYFGVHWWW